MLTMSYLYASSFIPGSVRVVVQRSKIGKFEMGVSGLGTVFASFVVVGRPESRVKVCVLLILFIRL
jgi:hypothetical protein